MKKLFEGKVALVTGGNSGIGKATALKFAQEGAKVVIAARRTEEGEKTVAEIEQSGGDALFIQTDIAQTSEVKALIDETVDKFGRLDFAFNNAGTGGGGGPLHEVVEEDWDQVMGVNLKGVWLCMKYQITQMLKQGGGAIVNVSSIAGLTGFSLNPTYSATKHGVIGLSKSASLQYIKQGIRINVVCPGVIMTPMLEPAFASDPEVKAWFESKQPGGQAGSPEEVAQAAVWLCSDAASFVNGIALRIDGGALAGFW